MAVMLTASMPLKTLDDACQSCHLTIEELADRSLFCTSVAMPVMLTASTPLKSLDDTCESCHLTMRNWPILRCCASVKNAGDADSVDH
jgi:hypothetical protein